MNIKNIIKKSVFSFDDRLLGPPPHSKKEIKLVYKKTFLSHSCHLNIWNPVWSNNTFQKLPKTNNEFVIFKAIKKFITFKAIEE